MALTKNIFAKFNNREITLEWGRLLFAALQPFSSAGYRIILYNNLSGKDLGKYGALTFELKGLELTNDYPGIANEYVYLFDSEDKSISNLPWIRKVCIGFDVFSPYRFSNPIVMPYPMHPLQALKTDDELNNFRTRVRKLRVFFSGDIADYNKNRVKYPAPKVPRLKIINYLIQNLDANLKLVNKLELLDEISNGPYLNKIAIAISTEVRVPNENWLDSVALADFFLCPPGIVMPMCHNIVEAMAIGTIPITNYPEWFNPPLQHLKDCIVFDSLEDLMLKLKIVQQMPSEQISLLKGAAIDYFNNYLRYDNFIRDFERENEYYVRVLMITERNMALNANKLRENSVLFRVFYSKVKVDSVKRFLSRFFSWV